MRLAAGLACAVLALSCNSQEETRASILLITIDTLRADHVGAFGGRTRTPALDRLASEGVRFDAAYTTAPLTLPAHVSIMSGQLPAAHSVRTNDGYRVPAAVPLVADRLRQAGYTTAAFVGAVVLRRATGIDRGFALFDDDMRERAERPAAEVAARATAWIDAASGPAFVWVHFFDPHLPYAPPVEHAGATTPYAGEVEYTDTAIAAVVDRAIARFGSDRLAIVAVADHGEGLGDHGEASHGALLYDSTVRVPLIVRLPAAARAGSAVAEAVSTSRIAATILQFAGERGPNITPSVFEPAGDEPAVAETLYLRQQLGWSPLYAGRFANRKVIDAPTAEMYDLAADPQEMHNIAGQQGAAHERLVARLRRELNAAAARAVAPAEATTDADTGRRLAALGYVSGGGVTRGVEPVGGVNPKERIALWSDVEKGLERAQAGDKTGASRLFERVLMHDAENVLALKFLGALALERDDLVRAIAMNERVLATGLHTRDVSANLALAYHRRAAELAVAGRTRDAIAAYERLVALDAQDLDARERLGALLHRTGRAAEARRHFEHVLAADRTRRAPALSLAIIELESGNAAAAVRLLEPLTNGWPGAEHARKYLEQARRRSGERR